MAIPNDFKINIGTGPNTRTGDPLRTAYQKSNAADEYLLGLIENINQTQIVSSLPTEPETETLYANTTDQTLQFWDGVNWIQFGGGESGNGLSAYELAVQEGFTGTLQEWLSSLEGADGEDGTSVTILGSFETEAELPATGNNQGDGYLVSGDLYVWDGSQWNNVGQIRGPEGDQGEQGLSAFQVWLNNGNTGTQTDFLNSLKGEAGQDGNDGISAYQVWLNAGNTGTEQDFLNSLKGDDGSDANVTAENIEAALTYTPANDSEVLKSVSIEGSEPVQPDAEGNVNLLFWDAGDLWDDVVEPEPYPDDVIILDPSTGFESWTVDRNSEATYVDANGVIQTAPPNEPRITHVDGEPYILVEREATNLIQFSSSYERPYWSWSYINATGGTFRSVATSSTGVRRYLSTNFSGLEIGRLYTLTVILKPLTTIRDLQLSGDGGLSNSKAAFDLHTGTKASWHIGGEDWATDENISIEPVGDGYFECKLSMICTSPTANIFINEATTDGNLSYTTESMYVFQISHIQFEVDEGTMPIFTDGTIATRLADNIYRPVPDGKTRAVVTFQDGTTELFENLSGDFTLPEGFISKVEFQD